jgi:hypothetical protein
VVAGGLLGLLILTVADLGVAAVGAALWLAFGSSRLRIAGAVVLATAIVVTSTWILRNEITMHAFIPVADNSGYNLILADSAHAGVRSGVNTDVSSYGAKALIQAKESTLPREVAFDNSLRDQALSWMRAHPVRAATLYIERVADYFAPYDNLATKGAVSKVGNLLATAVYLSLLALFLWRLVRWRSRRPTSLETLLIVLYLADALVDAVFVTRVRYRIPLDSLALVVVLTMLTWLPRPEKALPIA